MKSLADRVHAAIPANGLTIKRAIELTRSDRAHVNAAFAKLSEEGRAKIVRRGLGRGGAVFLFLPSAPIRACVICTREVTSKNPRTKTCSFSCARRLGYRDPDMRARHKKSAERSGKERGRKIRESGKLKATLNTPEQKRRIAENNRRSWADPEIRARREIAIKEAWTGEASKERRKGQRDRKLALWNDPDWKAKTVAAMQTGKRGRMKRAIIELAQQLPPIPERDIAIKVGLSLKQVKVIMRRVHRMGELERKPEDGRSSRNVEHPGTQWSPEVRARAVKTMMERKRLRDAPQSPDTSQLAQVTAA